MGTYLRRAGGSRELVVDLVSEAWRVDDGEGDAHAVLLKLCRVVVRARVSLTLVLSKIGQGRIVDCLPTFTGLILMPSSWWASSGAGTSLWVSTSLSHKVLTNVVRPVPD